MTIRHPGRMSDQVAAIEAATRRAEMDVLQTRLQEAIESLANIFDSIARGEKVDLTYPDGQIITITRARNRGEGR